MKKLLLAPLLAILFAQTAFAYSWNFPEINQDIEIMNDSTIHVTETIVADFTKDEHRGIFREIPIKYRDQYHNYLNLRLNLISVTDENGVKQPIAEQGVQDNVYLVKIGDANVWRDDVATYVLTYEIKRAVTYFDDHDELYWNEYDYWEVPVLKSTITVKVPEGATAKGLKAACYTGYYGSTDADCTAKIIDERTIQYTKNTVSDPGEGFTIVAGWPKDLVTKPSFVQGVFWYVIDNWPIFIPFIAFLFLFFKWWYTGRDPEHKSTIIPRYTPPEGLSALEVGTIVDEKVDLHDITAVIIDYAIKGYIKIRELKEKKTFYTETDYEIELLKKYSENSHIKEHEKVILDNLFLTADKVKLSSLKYKFYKHLSTIKTKTYENLTKGGYFVHNPQKIREIYMGIGAAIGGITFFGFGVMAVLFGPSFPIGILVTAGLFLIFGMVMPRKTLKGAQIYTEIRGLEEYIRTAEKDRIKFQEDANIFFEKLLPYAMVLKMADKWGDAFKDYYKKPPSWFDAGDMDGFNSNYLVNRLNNFTNTATTAFASSPKSSGGGSSAWSGGSGFSGGSSGGGFGGGGGGGW